MRNISGLMSAAALLMSVGAATAQEVATNATGMTLYTFDSDSAGSSTCYDDCATNWPPFLAQTGEDRGEGWTMIERSDKSMQWAYDGKPTYTFAGDKAAGEMSGDGKGGVWHVLKH